MFARRPGEPAVLEVQIHPANIGSRVRYLFISQRQLRVWKVCGVAVGLFLLVTFFLTPGVVGGILRGHEYGGLLAAREYEGDRLQLLTGRLQELEGEADELGLRVEKIHLAYGLPEVESIGQGGFPSIAKSVELTDSVFAGSVVRGYALEARLTERMNVLGSFLDEIHSFEEAHEDQVGTTPSRSPLRGRDFVLTSPFGTRRSPFTKAVDFHAGIDLAAPRGAELFAPADGLVTYAGRYPLKKSVAWWRYGNLVVLRHNDRFVTLFGHCDEIRVRSGQRVRQGEVLATVGNTGWSTSPHLHYEVRHRPEGAELRPVDPRIYILDHRWGDQERRLVRSRSAPDSKSFQPLPELFSR